MGSAFEDSALIMIDCNQEYPKMALDGFTPKQRLAMTV